MVSRKPMGKHGDDWPRQHGVSLASIVHSLSKPIHKLEITHAQ